MSPWQRVMIPLRRVRQAPVLPLSHYAHATHAALASLGAPPDFESLQVFELHLQEEYGGFRRDHM